MKYAMLAVPVLGLVWGTCTAQQQVELQSDRDKMIYSVGYQMGQDLKRQGMEFSPEVLFKGMDDAISGVEPLVNEQERKDAVAEFKKQLMAMQRAKAEERLQANLDAAKTFLAANAEKEGVSTLPSGLQYREIKAGEGKIPGATDKVTVNYRGTLIDGTEFDSSYKRGQPASFGVDKVIKGWSEALQMMKEGAKWELFIPPDLAYGARGAGGRIPPNSALIFEVELISVD